MTRIPTTLGTLLLAAQTLVVASTFLAVEADARIVAAADDGNRIVYALREFHREQARWPRHLGELVPKYLDRIPEPDYGRPGWRYAADAPASWPSRAQGSPLRLKVSPETLGDALSSRSDAFVLSGSWGRAERAAVVFRRRDWLLADVAQPAMLAVAVKHRIAGRIYDDAPQQNAGALDIRTPFLA